MISFIGKPGDSDCKIEFTPRPAFRENPKAPVLERKLVYGHRCPTCGNVIQALFVTESPVDLWAYEETAFISTSSDSKKFGTVNKFVPNDESKSGYSQYVSSFGQFSYPKVQHLVMKNHILQYQGLNKSAKDENRHIVSGGNPCANTGCFSRREDLTITDLMLFWGAEMSYINSLKKDGMFPTMDEMRTEPMVASYGVRVLDAYGDAPPVLLLPVASIKYTHSNVYRVTAICNYIRRTREKVA